MPIRLVVPSAVKQQIQVVLPASVAYLANTAVSADRENSSTANAIATTSSSTGIQGILTGRIATTDSDYASAKTRMVLVDTQGLWEVDCVTTSVTANYVGQTCDFATATALNVGVNTAKHFLIHKVITTGLTGKVQGYIRTWDFATTSA